MVILGDIHKHTHNHNVHSNVPPSWKYKISSQPESKRRRRKLKLICLFSPPTLLWWHQWKFKVVSEAVQVSTLWLKIMSKSLFFGIAFFTVRLGICEANSVNFHYESKRVRVSTQDCLRHLTMFPSTMTRPWPALEVWVSIITYSVLLGDKTSDRCLSHFTDLLGKVQKLRPS